MFPLAMAQKMVAPLVLIVVDDGRHPQSVPAGPPITGADYRSPVKQVNRRPER